MARYWRPPLIGEENDFNAAPGSEICEFQKVILVATDVEEDENVAFLHIHHVVRPGAVTRRNERHVRAYHLKVEKQIFGERMRDAPTCEKHLSLEVRQLVTNRVEVCRVDTGQRVAEVLEDGVGKSIDDVSVGHIRPTNGRVW